MCVVSHYRCPSCQYECLSVDFDDCGDAISSCCDEVCETYHLCATCDANEPHKAEEFCIGCLADQFITCPADFADDEPLRAAIAGELAQRLRPMLSVRQAGSAVAS